MTKTTTNSTVIIKKQYQVNHNKTLTKMVNLVNNSYIDPFDLSDAPENHFEKQRKFNNR